MANQITNRGKISFFLALFFFGTLPASLSQNSVKPMSEDLQTILDKEMLRKKLYGMLGKLPNRNRPISVKLVSTEERDGVIIEKLLLDLNGRELVPAYFSKPKNSSGTLPVVLFNHSHFGQYEVGKNEFVNTIDKLSVFL